MGNEPAKLDPNAWTPFIVGIGTWLFAMYQSYHGIHYVPDEWIIAIVLWPFGNQVYSSVRGRVVDQIKRLAKKD